MIQIYQDTSKIVITEDLVTQVEDWPYGIKYARWDNQTEVDWNWLNILENVLTPGCNIVDIGAHTGDTALVLAVAAKGGTVVAFEMGPPIEILRENIRLNPHLNIDGHHFAVSNISGTVSYTSGAQLGCKGCNGGISSSSNNNNNNNSYQ